MRHYPKGETCNKILKSLQLLGIIPIFAPVKNRKIMVTTYPQAEVSPVDAQKFTQKIKALENDSEGFFKLGGFMADSSSSADNLLEEALTDKYGIC